MPRDVEKKSKEQGWSRILHDALFCRGRYEGYGFVSSPTTYLLSTNTFTARLHTSLARNIGKTGDFTSQVDGQEKAKDSLLFPASQLLGKNFEGFM